MSAARKVSQAKQSAFGSGLQRKTDKSFRKRELIAGTAIRLQWDRLVVLFSNAKTTNVRTVEKNALRFE